LVSASVRKALLKRCCSCPTPWEIPVDEESVSVGLWNLWKPTRTVGSFFSENEHAILKERIDKEMPQKEERRSCALPEEEVFDFYVDFYNFLFTQRPTLPIP
jgi:hypothetical protein